MRIFVSGHHGYIGTIMSRLLREAGHTVCGADMYLYDDCTFGSDLLSPSGGLRRDIREVTLDDLAGCDAVVHLAGLCNDPLGDLLPEITYDINHKATIRLARLAKRAGIGRFVFSSSCSVYGAAGSDWVDEHSIPNPVTPYGVSKLRAEEDLFDLADDTFSPVFLRSATAYGFSPRIRFDLVVNNLVAYAVSKGEILLKSDGRAWRPLVHIEDISRAFLAAVEAPRDTVHAEVFNVGITTENYLVREVASLVEKTIAGTSVRFGDSAGPDQRSYRVDCSKIARNLPQFRPQWTIHRGILELHKRFSDVGLTVEDFEGPKYQRLAHLKHLMERGLVNRELRWTPEAMPEEVIDTAVPLAATMPGFTGAA